MLFRRKTFKTLSMLLDFPLLPEICFRLIDNPWFSVLMMAVESACLCCGDCKGQSLWFSYSSNQPVSPCMQGAAFIKFLDSFIWVFSLILHPLGYGAYFFTCMKRLTEVKANKLQQNTWCFHALSSVRCRKRWFELEKCLMGLGKHCGLDLNDYFSWGYGIFVMVTIINTWLQL